jgi:hypothetical protein
VVGVHHGLGLWLVRWPADVERGLVRELVVVGDRDQDLDVLLGADRVGDRRRGRPGHGHGRCAAGGLVVGADDVAVGIGELVPPAVESLAGDVDDGLVLLPHLDPAVGGPRSRLLDPGGVAVGVVGVRVVPGDLNPDRIAREGGGIVVDRRRGLILDHELEAGLLVAALAGDAEQQLVVPGEGTGRYGQPGREVAGDRHRGALGLL